MGRSLDDFRREFLGNSDEELEVLRAASLAGITLADLLTSVVSGSAAGGDLAGTFPNPTIAPGAVDDNHLSGSIGRDKLAAPEAVRVIGAVGQPAFGAGFGAFGAGTEYPGFWYDASTRLVHLQGTIVSTIDVAANACSCL